MESEKRRRMGERQCGASGSLVRATMRAACTRPGPSRPTLLTRDKFHYSSMGAFLLLASSALALMASLDSVRAEPMPAGSPASSPLEAFQQYLNQLRDQDQCGALFTGKAHGYDIKDYLVRTNDKYELHLHRLVHPEEFLGQTNGSQRAEKKKKKPYLLVHGLIGTSASFLTNIDAHYRAPPVSYDVGQELHAILQARSQEYQYEWQSTAEYLQRNSLHEQPEKFAKRRQFASSLELQFDGEHMRFGRDFRQAYKKFRLPKASIGYTTNSLAMTLANFGYDVWLVNLRGNQYSRRYNGPMTASRAEYWDFNIQTIIREDLAATIRFIERETALREGEHLGVVTYSYSSIHLMGLLTKFPKYQKQLRPIIMLAPTLLTGTNERGKFKYFMKVANQLISRNGPFPGRGLQTSGSSRKSSFLSLHNLDQKLQKLVCSLPVASKLCRLLEMVILGRPKQVASVRGLLTSDRKSALLQRDIDCGSTSKQILHQVIENLSDESIDPAYKPFAPAKQSSMLVMGRQAPARPSLMILHSDSDSISTPDEVRKIRDSALKTLTLADYLIREPNFEHTDFLFSSRNQYLVNAELVRMALVHDHLSYMFDAPPVARGPPPAAPYDTRRGPPASGYGGSSAAAAASGPGSATVAAHSG